MKVTRNIAPVFIAAAIMMTATQVAASCTWQNSAQAGIMSLSFDDIVISPTAEVGDTIARIGYSLGDLMTAWGTTAAYTENILSCSLGDNVTWNGSTFGTITYGGETFIDTGINGLAIRTSTQSTNGTNPSALGLEVAFPPDYSSSLTTANVTPAQYGQRGFQLVKIGEITGGGVIPGGTLIVNSISDTTVMTWQLSASTVTAGGCEVTDYPAEVDLGTAFVQRFRSPGETQNETDFSISLTCNSTAVSPTVTFDGSTDSSYPTVFTNTSGDNYAQNVGVQILKGGSVITPGSAISLGQATTTSLTAYEFSARLFRLDDEVTVGSLEVPVTFTIEYE